MSYRMFAALSEGVEDHDMWIERVMARLICCAVDECDGCRSSTFADVMVLSCTVRVTVTRRCEWRGGDVR